MSYRVKLPSRILVLVGAAIAAASAFANAQNAEEANVAAGDQAPGESAAPQIAYADPPPLSPEQLAEEARRVQALRAILPSLDYQRARYHPLHFKPAIDLASDAECLVCHSEVLEMQVRAKSPAGLEAAKSLAWYQTASTYSGGQATFHQRHLTTPYARAVMSLKCNFCHQGNDPREESPLFTTPTRAMASNDGMVPFTNRKMVNPSKTCLLCHGAMPSPTEIMGLAGPWPQARADMENEEQPNGCLVCHGEVVRTNRHNVSYLRAATIEDLAKTSSDVCFGCHGGRAWYRISYPYPRHPWPAMDTSTVPEWASKRSTESDPRYLYQPMMHKAPGTLK